MLTFIDKNEVYSERKFDEVSGSHQIVQILSHTRAFWWLFMSYEMIMQGCFFNQILAAPLAPSALYCFQASCLFALPSPEYIVCPLQITKEPTEPVSTELSFINSFGSNHSDLSDGVPL